jgi:hypothetical protein
MDTTGAAREPGTWFKSSYSESAKSCVEVRMTDQVDVRDTKDRSGPVLQFSRTAWSDFIADIQDGGFTIPRP